MDREGGPRACRVPLLLFLLLAAAHRLQSSAKHLPGWYFWTWLAQAGVSFPERSPVNVFNERSAAAERREKREERVFICRSEEVCLERLWVFSV